MARYRYVGAITSLIWIAIVNVLIFFALLTIGELVLRSASTVKSCLTSNCNLKRITTLKIYDVLASIHIGLKRFDNRLGWVPSEGFNAVIDDPHLGWSNRQVTVRNDGFRLNNPGMAPHVSDVLVVGDSFTFGDQVSNSETWPACLERKLNRGIDNGGVSSYGAAQSLLRASIELSKKNYSYLVFSVLVGHDFKRDRLSYFYGLAKPALVQTNNGIEWSAVSTRYSPKRLNRLIVYLFERSMVVAAVVNRLMPQFDFFGGRLYLEHPNAADKDAIIQWTLKEFSRLKIDKKILLLQYHKDLTDLEVLNEREKILAIANALSLKVVDTMDVLPKYEPQKLWATHHTPYGNEVVCEYLFQRGFHWAAE
jgi:hypothetical protein